MPDNGDPARQAVHDAIQQHGAQSHAGALLTGWALVAEWMDPEGERWLSKAHSPSTSHWAANGMHHEVLYGDWPDPDDE